MHEEGFRVIMRPPQAGLVAVPPAKRLQELISGVFRLGVSRSWRTFDPLEITEVKVNSAAGPPLFIKTLGFKVKDLT